MGYGGILARLKHSLFINRDFMIPLDVRVLGGSCTPIRSRWQAHKQVTGQDMSSISHIVGLAVCSEAVQIAPARPNFSLIAEVNLSRLGKNNRAAAVWIH